jgi:hypothetical protein
MADEATKPEEERDAKDPKDEDEDEEKDTLSVASASGLSTSTQYAIRPASSLVRVLDIVGASKNNGANAQIYRSNLTSAQRFTLSIDANNYYTIAPSTAAGLALEVAGGQAKSGANVHQARANSSKAQKWQIIPNADGSYQIVSALSSTLVLDVSGARDADSTNIQAWTANGTKAQSFYFIPLDIAAPPSDAGLGIDPSMNYTISPVAASKLAIDVPGASGTSGERMQVWERNNTIAQIFRIVPDGAGYYYIRSLCSGLYLDAETGNVVPTTPVKQWQAINDCQRWAIHQNSDGSLTFVAKTSGLALDVTGANYSSGTPMQLYLPNGTPAQRFVLSVASNDLLEDGGLYEMRSKAFPSLCVDVHNFGRTDGTNIQGWARNNYQTQKFLFKRVSPGVYTIMNINSGRYLTDANGNVAQYGLRNPATAQLWRAEPRFGGIAFINTTTNAAMRMHKAGDGHNVGTASPDASQSDQVFVVRNTDVIKPGYYRLTIEAGGRFLSTRDNGFTDGTNVQASDQNGTGAQIWLIEGVGNGYWTLTNARSDKHLDVYYGTASSGTNVQLYAPIDSNGQRWRIVPLHDGTFALESALGSSLVLDVAGGGRQNGANARIATRNNGDNQLFHFNEVTYPHGMWRADRIDRIMKTAHSLLGVPYVWLGVYPRDGGMDCASFTWYLYQQIGIDIGFETYDQVYAGKHVSLADAQPGDLILMYRGGGRYEHVVLYAGNGMIYEEPNFGGRCQYVRLSSKGAGSAVEVRRII